MQMLFKKIFKLPITTLSPKICTAAILVHVIREQILYKAYNLNILGTDCLYYDELRWHRVLLKIGLFDDIRK